jgi:hypothetical protein
MRPFLLCALLLAGCAAPRQPNSTEALAEQKQQALAQRKKENDKFNEAVRLTVRQIYVQDHPDLSADIRKAILKERLKAGMSAWQVVAAYSMWEYTTDPKMARYRGIGAVPLWALAGQRQTAGKTEQAEWILQRQTATQHLYFENGILTKWKG